MAACALRNEQAVRAHRPLPIDMLLSAVSILVVAQSSSEIPEGLMNNPVYTNKYKHVITSRRLVLNYTTVKLG